MKEFNLDLMKTREILSEFLLGLNEDDMERDVWDVRNTDSDFMDFAQIIIGLIDNKYKSKIEDSFKKIGLI